MYHRRNEYIRYEHNEKQCNEYIPIDLFHPSYNIPCNFHPLYLDSFQDFESPQLYIPEELDVEMHHIALHHNLTINEIYEISFDFYLTLRNLVEKTQIYRYRFGELMPTNIEDMTRF